MARYEDDYNDESKEQACFIATAAYGTPLAEEVGTLRQFRDEFLITNPIGRALVAVYYKLSPPAAGFISRHRTLRTVVRGCLVNPAVNVAKSLQRRQAS
jgi:hypothetical protein